MSKYRSADPESFIEYNRPSVCLNFLHYTWKTITCLFSHITLITMVVSYCVLGAYTFSVLEKPHEIEIKKNISLIRMNLTDTLWKLTMDMDVLQSDTFISNTTLQLIRFEKALLLAMKKEGWNGDENNDVLQWTFTGALFYSIIVITTIGYGHIAPKTTWGKVVTIFYAILGIPLMLLCLSNIGDVMATSFRFLYWRVCCYFCTKKPKRRRPRSNRSSFRMNETRMARSRNASFRRSMRTSTRSADSGFGLSEVGPYSHSDTDLRYHDEALGGTTSISHAQRLNNKMSGGQQRSRFADTPMPSVQQLQQRRPNPAWSRPQQQQQQQFPNHNSRAQSLDRRKFDGRADIDVDLAQLARTPILCNRYVVGKNEIINSVLVAPTVSVTNDGPSRGGGRGGGGISSNPHRGAGGGGNRRAVSMPRNYLQPPNSSKFPSPTPSDLEDFEPPPLAPPYYNRSHGGRHRRRRSPGYHPSPKMMTPLGYGHRSKYLDDTDSDDDYFADDDNNEYSYYENARPTIKPVPIWLCVFLVISYIIAGAFIFQHWEGWSLLDAAYFCFITLTTIGFGDLVPAKYTKNKNKDDNEATISIALCSLYLLFGISLLAMSFNLVQEEVIANVRSVAKTLGIIKNDDEDSEDDD